MFVVLGSLLLIAAILSARSGRAQPTDKPAPGASKSSSTANPASQLASAASCAGRACHGGAQPENKPIQQNEFSTWLVHDRHARAYAALLSERGQRIGRNLGIIAHEDTRCLACHGTPQLASDQLTADELLLRKEGVSCEACHGPANGPKGGWFIAHTTKQWREGTPEAVAQRLADHGMHDLSDLTVQASVCVGCHVGAAPRDGIPARDLNHDLMAAGHPRLAFELTAYRVNEPPHWNVSKYKDPDAYEARSWAVGQAVAARAAVELLAYRAAQVQADRAPWPEFAEADCFTCHADFGAKSWRRNPDYYQGRRPGSLPYSRWYSALLPALAPIANEIDRSVVEGFAELETWMTRTAPDPATVETKAKALATALSALVKAADSGNYDPRTIAEMLALVKKPAGPVEAMRWEQLVQAALAISALDPKASPQLKKAYEALAFPPQYESPALSHPAASANFRNRHAELVNIMRELLPGK
jgi:hypothetical protein